MGSMPFALSVHSFINSVGADAGFAAIIGLAVLVLLYFAHARETANLREEAAMLTQRLQQAEARVAQLSRAQPAAAPQVARAAPAAASAPQAAARGTGLQRSIPAAPAGVGAPALAAATRVVPVAVSASASSPMAGASPQPQMAATSPQMAGAASEAAPAASQAPAFAPEELEHPEADELRTPAPATVAGSNGARHEPVAAAPVAAAAAAAPAGAGARAGATGQFGGGLPPYQNRGPARPGGPRRPLPPLQEPAPSRGRLGRWLALVVGVLGVAAVVAVLLIATSGGSSSSSSTRAARTTNAPGPKRTRAAIPFAPSSVTVAVLNGTSTNQLAHTVATKLAGVGYKPGAVATAANQTQTSTVVAYLPGAKNRTDAQHVATALKLGSSAVQPIDQPTQQVACPPPAACTANVVVTVGADLSTL